MSIRTYWPFALGLAIFATSTSFISLRKGERSMHVTVATKGIPEHGLSLIGAGDSLFERNLSAAQRESSGEIPQAAKLLTAFVVNSTHRSVVAHHLRWNLVYIDGKVVSQDQSYKDPTLLMEHKGRRSKGSEGYTIRPESTRLVSLVPFLTEDRTQGHIGGAFLQPGVNTESVKQAIRARDPREFMNNLADDLDRVVTVTVSLDGAFFDDGTFVGPDESQFFPKLKAQVDARHDLYKRIEHMFSAKKPPQRILQYVTNLANMPRVHLGRDSTPDQFYDFFTRFYAQEISRIWGNSGEESVSHFVESAIREPWPSLKKL